jgi:hypothetical protein
VYAKGELDPMADETTYNKAIGELRAGLAALKPGQTIFDEIIAQRDRVLATYGPIFSTDHVPSLSKDEFSSFLRIENNCHWSGLYRQGLQAAADMNTLRKALELLLDETVPIQKRFPQALDMVAGLGKGTATAILSVAYPDVYGVWNNTSENALRKFGLWPSFDRGESVGGRYAKINGLLSKIRADLETDFWTLDALWWFFRPSDGSEGSNVGVPQEADAVITPAGASFALERQLEEFLLENWERTPLGSEWAIYTTREDPEAGNQYPTDVGPIDILAVHKKEPRLLVVELKRSQSTDQTVGQLLRYIGWVQAHLAKEMGKTVEGLIIAHKVDKGAFYALSTVPNTKIMTYEIEFNLKPMKIAN